MLRPLYSDDTCVAVLSAPVQTTGVQVGVTREPRLKGPATLHFNRKITSTHAGYGGIHPLIALDGHRANLARLVAQAIPTISSKSTLPRDGDETTLRRPDLIAVTRGPGMRSNLSCGLDFAKGLAVAWNIPMVGVHHMLAHTLTPRLVNAMNRNSTQTFTGQASPQFPFLTLLVSGGHTMLVHSKSLTKHTIIANTQDIAIGDALDKIGRTVLPGHVLASMSNTAYAKYLSDFAFESEEASDSFPVPVRRGDELHKPSNEYGWSVQTPLAQTRELSFSFSGLESQIERLWKLRHDETRGQVSDKERLLFARTAMGTACEHLGSRLLIALAELRKHGESISTLVVSGGVAASPFLRRYLRRCLDVRDLGHVALLFPPSDLCTDNAAMIAWAGLELFDAGFRSDLSCGALRKWSMDPEMDDGGIAGVDGWVAKPDLMGM